MHANIIKPQPVVQKKPKSKIRSNAEKVTMKDLEDLDADEIDFLEQHGVIEIVEKAEPGGGVKHKLDIGQNEDEIHNV